MIADIVVAALVIIAAAFALKSVIRQRKKGGCGCTCGKSDCPGCKKKRG
ncbi:MAG: FeoB-associated Cys-rich membrane protein [Treponema sp.]|nr:FeoB-associated Cys-rich membrane protein [Treponema sp.]